MVGKVSKKTSPIEIKILFLLSATLFCLWLSVSLGTPFLSFVGYVMRIIYTTRVHRTIFFWKNYWIPHMFQIYRRFYTKLWVIQNQLNNKKSYTNDKSVEYHQRQKKKHVKFLFLNFQKIHYVTLNWFK